MCARACTRLLLYGCMRMGMFVYVYVYVYVYMSGHLGNQSVVGCLLSYGANLKHHEVWVGYGSQDRVRFG